MKRTIATFVLTAAFGLSALVAQTSTTGTAGGRGNSVQHRIEYLSTLLSLSSAQQQQATTIFTTAVTADASVHSSMSAARQTLKTAVQANDAAGIEQAATNIGNLTTQMTANQAKADAAFYQILTPAQQTKLNQFESQGHGRMGGAGFRGRF